ncbi:MAG: TIGR01459 family HAD-type hydrolase [Anderseniella sp.]|nr:TIGR01459 family HAD-type hydrolase [Anderseniella sp.]
MPESIKSPAATLITRAQDLSRMFPVWLCDVWGVVHDGRRAFDEAVDALSRHRQAGGCVVLITNAPRPAGSVIPQMREFGVPDEAWDETVTSGDVTRELLNRWRGGNVHVIGPDEDNPLLDELPLSFTSLEQADAVLVTGLRRDGRDGQPAEQPEDYRAELAAIAARGLPMVCANPDRVVGVGGRLYPCAGSLADIYAGLGGEVHMAGKPYSPIYEVALARARNVMGRQVRKGDVVVIGDGLPTDVEGGRANGFPVHFITGGIHAADHDGIDAPAIARGLEANMTGLTVAGVSPGLCW